MNKQSVLDMTYQSIEMLMYHSTLKSKSCCLVFYPFVYLTGKVKCVSMLYFFNE